MITSCLEITRRRRDKLQVEISSGAALRIARVKRSAPPRLSKTQWTCGKRLKMSFTMSRAVLVPTTGAMIAM